MSEIAYRGRCSVCACEHVLSATDEAVAEARRLMSELRLGERFGSEGKMFGVLVGRSPDGDRVVLRAFSGMADGQPHAAGFVGPTRPFEATADAERETLAALRQLSERIETIDPAPLEARIDEIRALFDPTIEALVAERRRGKALRAQTRAAGVTDATERALETASQREGGRLRALRRERAEALAPLEQELALLSESRARLRRERRERSRALQRAMHETHGLVNFSGRYAKLAEFFRGGVPTGTGECCAPKLLQEAALRGIRPTGVAEFWWGPPPPGGEREHARFYPPCEEKCVPILGHLLCGLAAPEPLIPIRHEDADVLIVDKPAGLLSVPGRGFAHADCAETRVAKLHPGEFVRAVHRLDEATSGLLVLARSPSAHRRLGLAFAEGRVEKRYRARVNGVIQPSRGEIRLPIGVDTDARPRRKVDRSGGRAAETRFEVLERRGSETDLWLEPRTGRTHQLRVHCASPEGLAAPILGDALYGQAIDGRPLHLHAETIALPSASGGRLEVSAGLPRRWD